MKEMVNKLFGEHDAKIFYPFLLVIVLGFIVITIKPDQVLIVLKTLNEWIIFNLGWLLQLMALVAIGFAFVMIMGKSGDIKLGTPEDKPEFSTFSWVCMMFCAAFGMTIWMWSAGEIMYHLFQFEKIADSGNAGNAKGVPEALQYVFMNSSFHGWALFALGGAAIALPAYRKGLPMTLAAGLYGLMGEKTVHSTWGRWVDILGAVASIGGVAGSLGIGIAVLAAGIKNIFGLTEPVNFMGQIMILLAIIGGFIISAVVGIERGMKRLSLLNIYISIAIAIFVCVMGPTIYIFTTITAGLGQFMNNFFSLALWGDTGNFVEMQGQMAWQPRGHMNWWLVFYIMWWVSYIPFCGGFVARISKGRNLREFFLGAVLAPSALTILFFGVMSSASAYVQLTGQVDVWDMVQNDFGSAVYAILSVLPWAKLAMVLVFMSAILYGITTYDSTTQYVAIQMSGGNPYPKTTLRVFVGFIIGAIGLSALIAGKMDVLKALPVVFGMPFVVVLIAYFISLIKMLGMVKRGEL